MPRPGRPARLLALKVFRDTAALGGTSYALMALMAIGVCLYVLFSEARANLNLSYTAFYRQTRFADGTVLVQSAPPGLVDTVRMVPGVTQAMGRRVKNGTIILRDRLRKRVMGRFIGLPGAQRPVLNDLIVVRGRYLADRGECLVEQKFAEANQIVPGSVITGSYLSQRRDFVVVGLVASPEYLYPAPDKETPMAMPDTFGVCWLDDDALRQWLGMGKEITEVHCATAPGRADEVVRALRSLGERYGLRSWWTQAEQPSNHLLQLDLQGYQAMTLVFPTLFLFAAALSLYSALSRVIRMQTGVIGFLRSSGLSQREVMWHYVVEGGLLTAAGALPGILLGHWLSRQLIILYVNQLKIPGAVTTPHPEVMATAVALGIGTGVAAAWWPARRAARTLPAIAMRGEMSLDQVVVHDSALMAMTRYLPTLLRIPARGLLLRPSRTVLAVGGLAAGCTILLVTLGMYVSVMRGIGEFLNVFVRYELEVYLSSPHAPSLINAVARHDGVRAVTHSAFVPVRLLSGGKQASIIAYGVQQGQQTLGLPDSRGKPIPFTPGCIWITRNTARRLNVEEGDPLVVEWSYSSRERRVRTVLTIGGLLDSTFSGFALAEYHDLRRRLVDRAWPEATYGATIACSEEVGKELRRRLERDDMVVNINSMSDVARQIRTSLRITYLFIGVLVAFGAILAGAVLHGISSVGILERMRELATLRSLGFSAKMTTAVAALEVYLMATLGLAVGLPCGTQLNRAFLTSFETETFSYRADLPYWTHLFAAAIVFALVAWSLRAGVRHLSRIDLAQATKARE